LLARTRTLISFIVGFCAVAALVLGPAKAHDELAAWAQSAQEIAGPSDRQRQPMVIEDHFTERLAFNGMKADTACSGSRWIYDYAHHIAAGFDGGPEMILYIGTPPVKLPSRDLSHVSTVRGLRLGDTPKQVVAALKVPLSDITRPTDRRQFLNLAKSVVHAGDTHGYFDFSTIVFHDGHVVSIWLAHNED